MRNIKPAKARTARIGLSILLLSTVSALAQTAPNLSGLWKQDNDRCEPKRSGDVTLRIEQHDPKLVVETSISRSAGTPRHALQNYTTDGKVSVSTGADGDEFYTAIIGRDSALVFSIEEHEDGHVIKSKETWSIIEDGATLKRIRERLGAAEKQTLLYRRVSADRSEAASGLPKVTGK